MKLIIEKEDLVLAQALGLIVGTYGVHCQAFSRGIKSREQDIFEAKFFLSFDNARFIEGRAQSRDVDLSKIRFEKE